MVALTNITVSSATLDNDHVSPYIWSQMLTTWAESTFEWNDIEQELPYTVTLTNITV